ncbi:MAG: YkvA family protein, partial [Syntrophomonas sp.]
KDKRTPWYAKAMIALVFSYAVSPIDLIPDFVPVLGYLDDLLLIPAGIALAVKLIPADIIAECQAKQNMSNNIKMNKLLGGIIVAGIWMLIAYFIVKAAGLL